MTRRSFQQGYVGGPYRSRQGVKFILRYRLRMPDGKWKQRCETHYGLSGKKEARAILDKRVQELSTQNVEASEITLRDFVERYWRPYLDRKGVKPSTRANYDSMLNGHVLLVLGDLKLAEISPLHIEALTQAKLKAELSPKTVRNLIVLLQGIFSLAVDNDMVVRSPIRNRHKPTVVRREKPVWSAEQVRRITQAVPETHRVLFVCAALTGARLGELLGLQWKHVDLKNRKLRIEQSLWSGRLMPPKTPGSVRTILFGETLATALEGHCSRASHRAEDCFVFSKQDGMPLHPDVLRKDVLYPALDRLGIPRTKGAAGFHTFRHSAATFINSQTGNLKLAQKFLGHSNLNTTADVYTHTSAESELEAALAVERAIYGENSGNLFQELFQSKNKTGVAAVN